MRRWLSVLTTFAVAACGNSTGPAASRNNPGTGTATLKITADIDANDDPAAVGGFTTDYTVSVRDGAASPVSGATVTIQTPSILTLVETPSGSGDYTLTGSGFPSGDFRLDVVRGSDNVHGVILGGPGVHIITQPHANDTLVTGSPITVRWTVPSQAVSAEVETRDFGPTALPDTGAYVVPGTGNPTRTDQRVRVFRYNEVNIAGGLIGSRFRVTVRKTVEPIVAR